MKMKMIVRGSVHFDEYDVLVVIVVVYQQFRKLSSPRWVRAVTFCHLAKLTRSAFDDILAEFPDSGEQLYEKVGDFVKKRYCTNLMTIEDGSETGESRRGSLGSAGDSAAGPGEGGSGPQAGERREGERSSVGSSVQEQQVFQSGRTSLTRLAPAKRSSVGSASSETIQQLKEVLVVQGQLLSAVATKVGAGGDLVEKLNELQRRESQQAELRNVLQGLAGKGADSRTFVNNAAVGSTSTPQAAPQASGVNVKTKGGVPSASSPLFGKMTTSTTDAGGLDHGQNSPAHGASFFRNADSTPTFAGPVFQDHGQQENGGPEKSSTSFTKPDPEPVVTREGNRFLLRTSSLGDDDSSLYSSEDNADPSKAAEKDTARLQQAARGINSPTRRFSHDRGSRRGSNESLAVSVPDVTQDSYSANARAAMGFSGAGGPSPIDTKLQALAREQAVEMLLLAAGATQPSAPTHQHRAGSGRMSRKSSCSSVRSSVAESAATTEPGDPMAWIYAAQSPHPNPSGGGAC